MDEQIFDKLLEDIKQVRSRGVLVKLAFGGEQWGNIKVPTVVRKSDNIVNITKMSTFKIGRKWNSN